MSCAVMPVVYMYLKCIKNLKVPPVPFKHTGGTSKVMDLSIEEQG
jgi:hypothetical protein